MQRSGSTRAALRAIAVAACAALACAAAGGCGGDDDGGGGGTGAGDLVVTIGGTAVTDVDFGDLVVGQSTEIHLTVENQSGAATGGVSATTGGENADDFAAEATGGSCGSGAVAPGESCDLPLSFHPTATGLRTASLTIAAGSAGTVTLTLTGNALPLQDLSLDPSPVPVGVVAVNETGTATVRLTNPGPAPAGDIAIQVTGDGFSETSDDCPAVQLGVGKHCDIQLAFTAAALGDATGQLDVTTNAGSGQAALGATGGGRVTVSLAGSGTGSVTSEPAGIDCGQACSAALAGGSVTLTEAPGPGSSFSRWSLPGCGNAPTCTITVTATPLAITATFDIQP